MQDVLCTARCFLLETSFAFKLMWPDCCTRIKTVANFSVESINPLQTLQFPSWLPSPQLGQVLLPLSPSICMFSLGTNRPIMGCLLHPQVSVPLLSVLHFIFFPPVPVQREEGGSEQSRVKVACPPLDFR